MKVTEAAKNSSKQFKEAIRGNLTVRNAARKQYLESARGHYISALAGRSAEKQEHTNICAIVDASSVTADHTYEQVAEAEETAIPEQPEQLKTFMEMDVQMQFPKGLFKGSKKQLQAVKLHFNKTLSRNNIAQLAQVVDRLGVIGEEMGRMDAPDLEAMTTVSSDPGDAKESLLKEMVESSSLQKTVESLKAELQKLKREHAELKDNDVVSEFAQKNRQLRPFNWKAENDGCLADKAKYRLPYEEVAQNKNDADALKIKGKGRKRECDSLKSYAEAEKRPRATLNINEAKGYRTSVLDVSKSLPERMYTMCVSTLESCARIMNSEDEPDSSSQQPGDSNNLESGNLMAMKGRIKGDKCDSAPEFSIRDYVFSARNKDISTNWPFSQKNLQLCLKHGVKNVLPPFQPVESLRDGSVKRCLAEKSVSSEESNLGERPSVMKNHLVRGTTLDRSWNQEFAEDFGDLFPSPYVGDKDLAFQTTAAICQSEVGSVSTSNLPLSEVVSDEHEAAASAVNKTKSSVSQILDKKCGALMNFPLNNRRGTPEDITSACTAPSEAKASKICPVCESFSSSSNTTLNAHIDQCLSSHSSPNWMKNSKLINPKIKPRKMRSMADICATAPSCTLEDLDRRNGSNWATNVDIPSEDTGLRTEGSTDRVSSRYTVNNRDDGSVYVDSSGRKIRILSKFNETAPSSFPNPRWDAKVRKQSKKGKRSNLFSTSRKRHLVKHLKYLRVARQRKHFLSLKVKGCFAKACAAEKATYAGHESHMEHRPPGSFGNRLEVQEQKNYIVSETSSRCTSSKIVSMEKKNDPEATTKVCRYDLRPMKDLRVRRDHTVTGRTLLQKHPHLSKKPLCPIQPNVRTSAFDSAGPKQKSMGSSCGKTMRSPPPRSEIQGNREFSVVPLKFGDPGFNGDNTKDCVWTSLDSGATPAFSHEREIQIQPDTVHINANCKMSHSCHAYPFEEMRNRDPTRHVNKEIDDSVSSTSLAMEETSISLNPSLDPELQKVAHVSAPLSKTMCTMQCTDKFHSPLSRDESKAYFPQHCLREEQIFCRDVSAAGRSELKTTSAKFSLGEGNPLMEIDPILIPGPPGSDLPSFSDMGSEDLQRTSSFLEQSFEDGYNVIDGDLSDPHFSATSTIFNLDATDHVYQGWLGAHSPINTLTEFSESTSVKTERVTSVVNDLKEGQGREGGIPRNSAMNFQESQLQGQRMASLVTFPGEQYTDLNLTKWPQGLNDTISFGTSNQIITSVKISAEAGVQSHRTGDCDSATPAPILRLMGKDLMVVNNEEDDPSLVHAAQNVTEISYKHGKFWEHHSSQSPALIGPLPYVQDPHTFSVQCFEVGPSNMKNGFMSSNNTYSDMYVNKHQVRPMMF